MHFRSGIYEAKKSEHPGKGMLTFFSFHFSFSFLNILILHIYNLPSSTIQVLEDLLDTKYMLKHILWTNTCKVRVFLTM